MVPLDFASPLDSERFRLIMKKIKCNTKRLAEPISNGILLYDLVRTEITVAF